jgi:signal transduction histidine kinase
MNLVINAAEAIPRETTGSVVITTTAQEVDDTYVKTTLLGTPIAVGQYVALEVHNTGVGMDEDTLAHI